MPHERIRYTNRFDDPNLTGEMQVTVKLKMSSPPPKSRSPSRAFPLPAGFVDHSTAIPKYVGDQLNLLGLLSAFYSANPNYDDAAIGITGAAGAALKANSEAAATASDADADSHPR